MGLLIWIYIGIYALVWVFMCVVAIPAFLTIPSVWLNFLYAYR